MTTSSITWTEEVLPVAGAEMNMKKGGSGEPLLVLHGEMGQPGWLRYHDELARNHTVYAPSHPGFGITGRVDWIMNMRDMAGWYLRALEELQLVGVDVLGFSMGGWLTAEMAAQSPRNFKKLVLGGRPGHPTPGRRNSGHVFDSGKGVHNRRFPRPCHCGGIPGGVSRRAVAGLRRSLGNSQRGGLSAKLAPLYV